MGNQAEEKAELGETERKNRSTGKATVRQDREEGKGRNRKLSSRKLKPKQTKEGRSQAERPKAKAQGKHLRNSCGKRIREGRKETNRKPSTRTGKEGMRNQAGDNGESEEAKAKTHTGKTPERWNREERKGRTEG